MTELEKGWDYDRLHDWLGEGWFFIYRVAKNVARFKKIRLVIIQS
jgi:hypothetical protein